MVSTGTRGLAAAVCAFVLLLAVQGCAPSQPDGKGSTQEGPPSISPPSQSQSKGFGGSLIERLYEQASLADSGVVTASGVEAAQQAVDFPVFVPAETKGRGVTAVFTERRLDRTTGTRSTSPDAVWIVYGDDIVASHQRMSGVTSAEAYRDRS
jgi:hypothetical protein